MIQISQLKLITDPQEFFSTDKILFVEIFDLTDIPGVIKIHLSVTKKGFEYKSKFYAPICMTGSPENMFLNLKNGVESDVGYGISIVVSFDGNLPAALNQKKVYNFDKEYKPNKRYDFAFETDFFINRYIVPFEK